MAHVKLFFPGLSNSNALANLINPHSALTSLLAQPEQQNNDKILQPPRVPTRQARTTIRQWNRSIGIRHGLLMQMRQRIHSLRFVNDIDSNDYSDRTEKDQHFVHVLQLAQDQCSFSDIQTVRSQTCGGSGKEACQSETQSVEYESEVMDVK